MNELLIQPTGPLDTRLSSDGGVTISIPIQIRKRSGRKQITLPSGEQLNSATQMPPLTSLQSALVRGHRWLHMLNLGELTSLKAIAALEHLDERYVSRMVNLTTLAPDVVAAILDDDIADHLTVDKLAISPPILWCAHHHILFSPSRIPKT